MKNLTLENYGVQGLSLGEMSEIDGGTNVRDVLIGLLTNAVYDTAKVIYAAIDKAGDNGGCSPGYHAAMSSSNCGGIR
jgi:hypothetical protein